MYKQFGINIDALKLGYPNKKVPISYGEHRFEISTDGILYDGEIYNKIDTYSDREDDGITDRYYCALRSGYKKSGILIQFECEKDADDFDTVVYTIIMHLNNT